MAGIFVEAVGADALILVPVMAQVEGVGADVLLLERVGMFVEALGLDVLVLEALPAQPPLHQGGAGLIEPLLQGALTSNKKLQGT